MDSTCFSAAAPAPASPIRALFPDGEAVREGGGGTEARTQAQVAALRHRLTRIEGQVRGLHGLIDRELRCVDILTQSSAIISALRGFEREILSQHIRGHLAPALRAGVDGAIDEFADCLRRSIR